MCRILLFGEDYGHEVVLRSLLDRLAEQFGLQVDVQVRSARGGHGPMLRELKDYLAELGQGRDPLPDLMVVARDANCQGHAACVNDLMKAVKDHKGLVVVAVPDPHIERWLLLDSQAFKQVVGKGCEAPDMKCARDHYKVLLDRAVRAAGLEPLLGGLEFAEDVVRGMNLQRAEVADASFAHLLRDLRAAFQQWASA